MSTISIRPYTPADREACHRIFVSNIPTYFSREEEADYLRWLDGQDGILPPEDGDGETKYFVLEREGDVLACGGWGVNEGSDHAVLIWGAVHGAHHKQGLGAALTQYRLDDFRRTHPGMDITIDTSHHTAPFYERYGFRTLRITRDAYAPGLHRYDMRLAAGHRG